MASRKSSSRLRNIINDVIDQLKSGATITDSISAHGTFFPDLFVDMLNIGEETGSLPEVLKSLSSHYENNVRLKKEFVGQITLPMIQLGLAIFIIAGVIFLLGIIGEMTGATIDIFGWGLIGGSGALLWLGGWAMLFTTLYVLYQLAIRSVAGQKALHRTLLKVPVLGHCLRSFAIARFAWSFSLTQQAGMAIEPSLKSSFRATSNGAFISACPDVIADIMSGETLSDALTSTELFPMEFEQIVHVAETSGTVPEALDRLSPQFEEDARRSMRALAAAAGWLIWTIVAGIIIFIIFKIAMWYLGMINSALDDINNV